MAENHGDLGDHSRAAADLVHFRPAFRLPQTGSSRREFDEMMRLFQDGGPAAGQMKRLLPLAFLVFCASFSSAQQAPSGTQVNVQVVDESGAAVVGAHLAIVDSGYPATAESDSTDARGEWSGRLAPGTYRVRIEHPGFQPAENRVEVGSTALDLRINLRVAEHVETVEARTEGYLPEQETTAARVPLRLTETPQQIEVLTGELLQARAAESMKQAMEMVPAAGLQLGEGRRDNFFIRGFNPFSVSFSFYAERWMKVPISVPARTPRPAEQDAGSISPCFQ